ncbi:MAG: MBL fold metallo-hydrolase [Elusimicrobiota bacterium]
MTFDIVANNIPFDRDFQPGWGNACLIRTGKEPLLFDTGGDGDFLLHNLKRIRVAPARIKRVVLSHDHDDHTGGLWSLLRARPGLEVLLPAAFSKTFKTRAKKAGARLIEVRGPRRVCDGVFSTGEMRGAKREQALAVRTPQGLAILTGCAHPGIAAVVRRCVGLFKAEPYLALGGFHLRDAPGSEIDAVIDRLRKSGVKRIAPNHCTGALAKRRFRSAWGGDYVEAGCGARVDAQ